MIPSAKIARRAEATDFRKARSSARLLFPAEEPMGEALLRSALPGLPEPRRGKVRDVYDLGDELLIVTTDRISAFDVVLAEGIPDKGRVLSSLSRFWFGRFDGVVRHHLLPSAWAELPAAVRAAGDAYRGRTIRAVKADPLPVEWIVRAFITGSLWSQYERGEVRWSLDLPAGLAKGDRLPQPVFTPTTKAETGHDEPMTFEALDALLGPRLARTVRERTLDLFERASAHARERGVILVDTKLEWGLVGGELTLIDECFTPDSSRFVLAEQWKPGGPLDPYDKQLARDFLLGSGWDREGPPPALPPDVIAETRARYVAIHERLTGTRPEGV